MKNAFLLTTLLWSLVCFAQTTSTSSTSKIGLYKWNVVMMMQPANVDGTDLLISNKSAPKIPSKAGQKFRVIDASSTKATIMILDYTSKNAGQPESGKPFKKFVPQQDFFKYNFRGSETAYNGLQPEEANSRNYGGDQAYFTIDIGILADANLVTQDQKIGGALALGVLNFPFKYRPQKGLGDFSGAFNFGAGVGYKFPHKSSQQFTYSILSGYSISNIVLDSSNTTKNQGSLSSSNNYTAFSFSLGALAEYQKVQVGIFLGWDRISHINQREFGWVYQGKPWISIGFGVAVFAAQQSKSDASSTTQK